MEKPQFFGHFIQPGKPDLTPEAGNQLAETLSLLCHIHTTHGNTPNSRFDSPGQPTVYVVSDPDLQQRIDDLMLWDGNVRQAKPLEKREC